MGIHFSLKRLSSVLLAAVLATLPLSGCQKTPAPASAPGQDRESMTLHWFVDNKEQSPETDRVLSALQKTANLELQFIQPAGQTEIEALSSMLASDQPLDLVTLSADKLPAALGFAKEGLLLPFDDYVSAEETPALHSLLNAACYAPLKVDSKAYLKPIPSPEGALGYYIRTDWLDNTGLSSPTTAEEFLTVCKAFTQQDPDQNGQNDTLGFYVADPVGSTMFGFVARAFGHCAANGYDFALQQDGTPVPFLTSDTAYSAFLFLKRCYDEGVFNRDYTSLSGGETDVVQNFCQSKAGIIGITDPVAFYAQLQAAGLQDKVSYLPPLQTEQGEQGTLPSSGGFAGINLLPKNCAHPDWVTELLEWCLTEQGKQLCEFGEKGTQFTTFQQQEGVRLFEISAEEMAKDWDPALFGCSHPLADTLGFARGYYLPLLQEQSFEDAVAQAQFWLPDKTNTNFVQSFWAENQKYVQPLLLQDKSRLELTPSQQLYELEITGRNQVLSTTSDQFNTLWLDLLNQYNELGGKRLALQALSLWSVS